MIYKLYSKNQSIGKRLHQNKSNEKSFQKLKYREFQNLTRKKLEKVFLQTLAIILEMGYT